MYMRVCVIETHMIIFVTNPLDTEDDATEKKMYIKINTDD